MVFISGIVNVCGNNKTMILYFSLYNHVNEPYNKSTYLRVEITPENNIFNTNFIELHYPITHAHQLCELR